jgi:hypothetical protein
MSIKIKAKGKDALNLMELKSQFKAHDPQRDLDTLNGDGGKGQIMMKENPQSRQAEDTNKGETSDITKPVVKSLVVPTAEAVPVQGYDVVQEVNRTMPADSPERARRHNNQVRDMRTNLGRGKSAVVIQN